MSIPTVKPIPSNYLNWSLERLKFEIEELDKVGNELNRLCEQADIKMENAYDLDRYPDPAKPIWEREQYEEYRHSAVVEAKTEVEAILSQISLYKSTRIILTDILRDKL
ncbi:hypothetical protein CDG76_17785 [Nostoc sp. 'Peltigera membranacea cyanobiont' 210A]|uniref:hypothetical protein n=1 Tax=Nostoc sp. 'Peltigera membranacea cyanobiont' 210A TaxID=2014529 RepID=UPI000B9513E0|nr:hypothetical protein [Nostoc sp. 'Peltigera membranacea cyanobiont' 210A]OYD93823.1 hypothetical protein CDG76_17785 [Nostoc sp. 'Peltigera membranacea cyanobiont' 210A]